MIYGSYAIVNNSGSSIYTYTDKSYYGYEAVKSVLGTTDILLRCSPWAKLFKREIIEQNNLKFDESLPHSEDRLFLYQYLLHVKSIRTTSGIGYLYANYNTNSLKHKKLDLDVVENRQQKLTEFAMKVVEHFGLVGGEIFNIGSNLINLGVASLQSIYDVHGFSTKTVNAQKSFIKKYFGRQFSENLLTDRRLALKFNSSELADCRANRLWRVNLNRFVINAKINAHAMFPRKRVSPKISFKDFVVYLNS